MARRLAWGLALVVGCSAPSDDGTDASTSESSTSSTTDATTSTTTTTGTSGTSGSESSESSGSSTGGAAALMFVDITDEAGVSYVQGVFHEAADCIVDDGELCRPEWFSGGAAAADYDLDGLVDLYATRLDGTDLLFHNDGDGTFSERSADAGLVLDLPSNGATWADIDNDGDADLYVTVLADTRHYLFINDGTGQFTEEAVVRGAATETVEPHTGMSASFGDYDLDGYLDLYVTEWQTNNVIESHSRLLHNLGSGAPGTFEDVTTAAGVELEGLIVDAMMPPGVYSFAPTFTDLDDDGWPELVIVSDFRRTRLFWNNGDGTFLDGTDDAGVGLETNGMGSTFGDWDSDGDLDWFVTSVTYPGDPDNRLYRNEGDRTFTELAEAEGVGSGGWGWGTAFFDHDNDADLDLVMTNGWIYGEYLVDPIRFWDQQDGAFVETSDQVGLSSNASGRGLLSFDYDADGDLDLFLTHNADVPILYRNDGGNQNDWLRVRAIGTTSNRDGIGARVTVRVEPNGPSQLREIGTASHYLGQSEPEAHFGLGDGDEPVAEVRVWWPASGQEQLLSDVDRNQVLVVQEPG